LAPNLVFSAEHGPRELARLRLWRSEVSFELEPALEGSNSVSLEDAGAAILLRAIVEDTCAAPEHASKHRGDAPRERAACRGDHAPGHGCSRDTSEDRAHARGRAAGPGERVDACLATFCDARVVGDVGVGQAPNAGVARELALAGCTQEFLALRFQ